jgi:amino acid adenylation domain-containing protein
VAYQASFGQSRLWFLHQLDPELTAYHLPAAWRLRGDLDVPALQKALEGLIERHSTLRTSFLLQESEVIQIIHPAAPFALAAEALGERDPEVVIKDWLEKESRTPFDLTTGLLLRARLLRVEDQQHVLLTNHHHIASDGWSLSVMARDLVALYNAVRTRRSPQLEPLSVHYQDYAAWQRQRLSSERLQQLNDFWFSQLRDLEPLELPSDHPRPVTPSYRGENLCFQIEPALLQTFEDLCRREGATLQMGLLALVALLLHRTSRQDDFAIGIPIWGRNHPDLERLIGFFINTLPIPMRFEPGLSFRQLLALVRESSIRAYDHQELPFEQMVEALNLERDTSRNPLVQVMLQLAELPESSLQSLDNLEAEHLNAWTNASRFEMEFFLQRHPSGSLNAHLIYAADLFSADRIERLSNHLLTLLGSVVKDPDAAVDALNLLPQAERQLIESWQQGPTIEVPDLCVHQLFEQQVVQTPEAIALVFEDQQISYGELNARANQLAHLLIDRGVGPEVIVALAMERSIELVVALLAILKAGGAFLPLDPSAPPARLAQLLALADEPLVLCDEASGRDRLAASRRLDVAAFAQPQPTAIPTGRPPEPASPASETAVAPLPETAASPPAEAAAYLLFTSGTTGTPKAVLVEHQALALRCQGLVRMLGFGPGVRVLAQTTPIFDIAILELLIPLAHGATVVIATDGQRQDPRQLTALIEAQAIDVLQATPSLLGAWAAAGPWPTRPLTLLAGGEPFPVPLAALLCRPGLRVLNGYGPTEAAIYATMAELEGAGEAIPIGRPIAGTTVRVLDAAGQLCPIGVVGELHICGAGLARGYRNDGERTAAAFVADPYSDEPGARLYRSGDLAAWNADGTLAFHGRRDGQIKLRGVRIEPGEIEAALAEHSAVSQVAVVLRRDDPANPLHAAYWVPSMVEGDGLAAARERTAQLRAFLKERLPAVMVPAAFVALAALPLTPNGKLDRRALPAPWSGFESPGGESQGSRAAAGDLERVLMELWQEVLGHAQFGVEDHFFQVGGHSLAVARLALAVEATLGRSLPVAEVFRHPTIREQVNWLSEVRPAPAAPHLVVLQPRGERPPLHVVHGYGGTVGAYIDLARALGPHRPVFGLQARAGAQETATPEPVTVLADRYAEQILERHPGGPIHLLGYSAGGWYAFAVADALLRRGAPVGLFAVLDTHANARIHRRLGVVLLAETVLPRLVPRLRELVLPPSGERRRRLLLRRSRSLNRILYGTLQLRLPGPERLAAALAGRPFANAAEEPFLETLRQGYRPPRLPLAVDLFAPPAHHPQLQRLWSFYAQGGVRVHPLFRDHDDFYRPALMPELAQALEQAIAPLERDP